MGNSNSQATSTEEKYTEEGKTMQASEAEKKYLEKEKTMKEKLEEIGKSLQEDPSQDNALSNYAEMLQLKHDMNGGLAGFGELVADSKKQWDVVDTNLDKMKRWVTPKEICDLKELRIDYFSLLLRTGVMLSSLLERCDIQQENLGLLIELTEIQKECAGYKFTKENDQISYNSCMDTLKEFINDDILQENVNEWTELAKKIQERQEAFTKYSPQELVKRFKKQGFWMKVAIGLGSVVVIAGVVAAIVASSGAVGIPAGVIVHTLSIGGIGIGSGIVVVGTAVVYGKFCVPSKDILDKMKKITDELKHMLKTSERINDQISNGILKNQKPAQQRLQTTENRDPNSPLDPRLKLKSFNRIMDLLQEYSKQGNTAVVMIETEVKRIMTR